MLDQTDQTAPPGGTLVVSRARSGASGVRIRNRRLLSLDTVLCGLTPAAAPDLLRRLLPVCGWAQGIACIRAIEAATGARASPATETARARLVLAETAQTQLWRSAIDWPALVGNPASPGPVRKAREAVTDLVAALWPDGSPLGTAACPSTPAADRACCTLADLLDAASVGLPGDPAELAAWADGADTRPSALLRRARALAPGPGLDADAAGPDVSTIAGRLVRAPDFGRAPGADGHAADVTPLPMLPEPARRACAALGPVAGRLAAAMFDARQTARCLRAVETAPAADIAAPLPDGWGAGSAATARGPLVQALRIAHGRVEAFRSVAPTEWMLHPDGALMRCLARLPQGATEADIRLAFAAFDPCAPLVFAGRAARDA